VKIIGIIPARFASTRFPGKPLASDRGQTANTARGRAMLESQIPE
jgi:CMP-2-keto-3-deoxyoctulosonic acid synthetase